LASTDARAAKLVVINPFCNAARDSGNLSDKAYLRLIAKISKINHLMPLVISYPRASLAFVEKLKQIKKLKIIHNNENIFNAAALLRHCSCVISPSTGLIHLANNLGVPTIGLFRKYDTKRWATYSKNYVIIKPPLSNDDEDKIIESILKMLEKVLD